SFATSVRPSSAVYDSMRYGPADGNSAGSISPGVRVQPVFQNSAMRRTASVSFAVIAPTRSDTPDLPAATWAGISSVAPNSAFQFVASRPGRKTTVASFDPG